MFESYQVVASRTLNGVMKTVNHRMTLGYIPIGGITESDGLLLQAIYRVPDPNMNIKPPRDSNDG